MLVRREACGVLGSARCAQDGNLGWLYRQVACGPNHTVAVVQVT